MGLLIRDISLGKNMSKKRSKFQSISSTSGFLQKMNELPNHICKKKPTVLSVPDFPQVRIGHET